MRGLLEVEGHVDERFGAVRDAFWENFVLHDERGAAVCVVVDGVVVVDLWGGHRDVDRRRAWERDTLVDVFSVGKALLATAVARLVGVGAIDYDATVASVWPEFAAQGKGDVTLRQLLSHTAGLPSVRQRLSPTAMLSPGAMLEALAGEGPGGRPAAPTATA